VPFSRAELAELMGLAEKGIAELTALQQAVLAA
jgi:ribonuclease PH